ncbi:ABC transporter ATP-binding protein [Hazenella sp. IB182357]|uniref:ABC transporter ATP-binding protein n=1 Tax=Polycladospora coralii TaxID=2771432 RepID=A0A926RT84_9BACL|nr:ABC transporter ATP-binding protein [Polycladospora coralii]MBD1371012.1 ABC transporter ATP-binding protein [Polycladospora coralii]MBS7529952.1 ABC transporter ATP-binding protein [Polycladospora coralii]
MSILSVQKATTRYEQNLVFQDLDLDIKKGVVTSIIGPNGCGKSTLLKTIGRILKPKSGKIYLQDQELTTIPTKKIAKHLALLPQNPIAPSELNVEELISYGRYPHLKNINKLTSEDKDIIEWSMEITHTLSFRDRQLHNLSGGQRQKVWLAMALAQKTEIILLDEPTTFLDLAHQLEVLQIIERLNADFHCTIVMVLHDINHAARFSHEIVAMKKGSIVAKGTPAQLITTEILEQVFQIRARVMTDPHNGSPVCYGYESTLPV